MKFLAAILCFILLPLTGGAAPKIEVFGGSATSVTVALTNCDKKPYYYSSMFVNDLPYAIEVTQNGQTREIPSEGCGTGAVWQRLEPKRSIRVEIDITPEAKLSGAKAIFLIYDSAEKERKLIPDATVEMSDALDFLRTTGLDKLKTPGVSSEGFSDAGQSLSKDRKKAANQTLVPTPASVTPAADAPVTPDAGAAHL